MPKFSIDFLEIYTRLLRPQDSKTKWSKRVDVKRPPGQNHGNRMDVCYMYLYLYIYIYIYIHTPQTSTRSESR